MLLHVEPACQGSSSGLRARLPAPLRAGVEGGTLRRGDTQREGGIEVRRRPGSELLLSGGYVSPALRSAGAGLLVGAAAMCCRVVAGVVGQADWTSIRVGGALRRGGVVVGHCCGGWWVVGGDQRASSAICLCIRRSVGLSASAIAFARSGGTALPTWNMARFMRPSKMKSSGKD